MRISFKKRALICVRAAEAAYYSGEKVKTELGKVQSLCQFNDVTDYVDKETDSQAFMALNSDVVLVAFRGSEVVLKDILTDARTRLERNKHGAGLVHLGFQTALRGLEDTTLFTDIHAAMAGGERQLWLTGHSLGGALVTLAAQLCEKMGIEVHTLCTFGSPMVGDSAFAEAFDRQFSAKYQRYVHHNDIVTQLPSSQFYLVSAVSLVVQTPMGAYRHVGLEYRVGYHPSVVISPDSAFKSVAKPLHASVLDSLTDHPITSYIDALSIYSAGINDGETKTSFESVDGTSPDKAAILIPNEGSTVAHGSQGFNPLNAPLINDSAQGVSSARSSKSCCVVS